MKTNTSDARAFPSVARIAFASFTLLSGCFVASAASPVRPAVSSAAPSPLSALEHGLRPTTLKAGEALPGWSLQERMAYHRVPGVAIAVLKDGDVIQAGRASAFAKPARKKPSMPTPRSRWDRSAR